MFRLLLSIAVLALACAAFLMPLDASAADPSPSQAGVVNIRHVVVVRPDDPNPIEQWAAHDLADYLGRIGECDVPVLAEGAFQAGEETFPIYLGRTAPGKELLADAGKLGPDEFLIAGGLDEGRLVIAGRDLPSQLDTDGPSRYREWATAIPGISNRSNLGTCRGVWHVLREWAGVRWYLPGPDGEIVPKAETLAIPAGLPIRRQPSFEIRSLRPPMRNYVTEEFCRWYYRVGFGMPGRLIVANHTMPTIGRWIKAGHGSKEMLAERNGSRHDTNYLCHHNPDLPRLFFDRLMIWPRKQNMEPTALAVMPADGYRATLICECDLCKADREEGLRRMNYEEKNNVPFHNRSNTTHYVWPLVLKVAEIARKESPESYVTCCAYSTYGAPPKEPETFPENVGVQICKERLMYMDDARRQRDRQRIAAWSEKVDAISVWEYYCFHMWGNPIPLHCPRNIADDLQFLEGKVLGEQIEIESLFHYNMNHSGLIAMDGLNVYVTARFMLDAKQDIDALLDEYYRLFFGPAEATMRTFYEDLETHWSANPEKGRKADKYDLAFAETCMERLQQARSEVPAESVYARRIDALIADFKPWLTLLRQKKNPPTFPVARVVEEIKLDADFGESAWQAAKAMPYTMSAGYAERGGFEDYQNCTTRLMRTPEAIYLAARIGTDASHPYASQLGNPQKYERYQAVFADPVGRRYVLTINGAGKPSTVLLPREGSGMRKTWDAEVQVAQKRTDDAWLLEIRIPTDAFASPIEGPDWRFNSEAVSTYVDPQRAVMNPHLRKKRGHTNYVVTIQPRVQDPRGQDRRYLPTYYANLRWE